MNTPKRDLPASVAARLLHMAKASGDDYQVLFTSFCFERLLFRLGASTARDRFVLKGAMLLRLWSDQPYRMTRDLDLLHVGNSTHDSIREDLDIVCRAEVDSDAVEFDASEARIGAIRAETGGFRVALPARSGRARLQLQIDIGFGDSVWPAPQRCLYPGLLDFQPPEVLVYPREVVVAEKLEAIVVLGERNSRIKDFFDLRFLASRFDFERTTLSEAIRRTFERRGTPIPADPPVGLTAMFWENPSRPAQVSSFARRAGLTIPTNPVVELAQLIGELLLPLLADLHRGTVRGGAWPPGGPWR